MTKKSTATPAFERDAGHDIGLSIGAVLDSQTSIAAGFRASRNPALRELRKARNEQVVDWLVAEEMAKLQA